MNKRAVSTLSLSAAALIALFTFEGYTREAVIPTKGDVPTVGFGSTINPDGSKVKMGDTIDPVNAAVNALNHIQKDEELFKLSLPGVELNQSEYDVYIDWVYQYGMSQWNTSTMRRRLMSGDHVGACNALLLFKYSGGYDCSTTIDGERNKVCWGVWERQLARNRSCLAAQGENDA